VDSRSKMARWLLLITIITKFLKTFRRSCLYSDVTKNYNFGILACTGKVACLSLSGLNVSENISH